MRSNIRFQLIMCMTLFVLVLGLAVPFSMLYFRLVKISQYVATDVVEGYANLEDYDFVVQPPISLDGEYIAYKGIFQSEASLNYDLMQNPTYLSLPTADLQLATETYTYQVFVNVTELSSLKDEVLISIPFIANDEISFYINGFKVSPISLDDIYNNTNQLTYYSLTKYYDSTKAYQEICISVNQSNNHATLFKRDIAISTYDNQLELYKLIVTVEAYFIGMILVSILNTIIYLILYPKYSILVLISLFDTILMIHCFFNMLLSPTVIANLATITHYFNHLFRSLDLVALFLAALLSNVVFTTLFHTNQTIIKKIDKILTFLYLTITILVLINPAIMSGIGYMVGIVLSILTFISLLSKFIIACIQKKVALYEIFHFIKSCVICGTISLDFYTINQYSTIRTQIFTVYCILFVINLTTRCFEYRLPFTKIKDMNTELEGKVAKRTQALTSANEALQKLIERDALTNAYNRLYFENKLRDFSSSYLQSDSSIKSVYLCIFDADSFKRINDTYGHSVGDDQLIEMANLPLKFLTNDIVLTRIGGEEFALLFTNHTNESVLSVLELIRIELETIAVAPNRTTASFGVAKLTNTYSKKEFFSAADQCLYHSKTNGKNMISYNFDGSIKVYKS